MKLSVTQAYFDRNLAVQQVSRLKQEIEQLSRDRHAVSHTHIAIW